MDETSLRQTDTAVYGDNAASGDMSSSLTSTFQMHSVNDYHIEDKIGSGKFSTVWIARSVRTDMTVALKKIQLFDMMDAVARRNCLREVNMLQSLDHENIIRYLEAFMQDNDLVIALEGADRGDLSTIIHERRQRGVPFSEFEIWDYFTQICAGLRHMHQKRIMHRDLKPSNLFLSVGGKLKLGDLGLSRYFSSKTLQVNSVVGTPYYMSPECIRELPYDWSSDVWSLGCILYELITLRSPFYSENLNFYLLGKKITNCEYEAMPESVPEVMRRLVSGMIQKDPKQRPDVDAIYRTALERREQLAKESGGIS